MLLYILGLLALLFLYRWYRELARVPGKGDKHVYVTGCDSGFGNLLAKHLDKLGFPVIAACFTDKGEEELRKATSDRLCTLHLNVTSPDSVGKAAAFIKEKVGEKGLWAVVNNAGVSLPSAPWDWLQLEDTQDLLNVNLNGVIAVTISVLPLIKRARGRVVNVASVFGRISPFGGAYCISKYGVEAFNDSLRRTMAHFGVKVLCIEPGFFKTGMFNMSAVTGSVQKIWDRLPQEVKDDYGSDYVDRTKGMIQQCENILDTDVMKVVRCMEHAVAAVHPRTRYSPGWDAMFFWIPLSYMPTCISDYVLLRNAVKPAKSVQ